MTNKKYFTFVFSLFISSFLFVKTEAKSFDIPLVDLPEKAGTYLVPGRPDLKLHVFVYHVKGGNPAKPQPPTPPAPTLVCNLTDPNSDTVSGIESWHLPSVFYYYLNTPSVPSSVGSQNMAKITTDSFFVWTDAINYKVVLLKKGETSLNRAKLDGFNIISWGRASSGTLGITYIWSYTTGEVAEIDTIMNKIYSWTWSNPSSWTAPYTCAYANNYDAQNILTHELGHWFGVDDDYETAYQNNTMYGYGDVQETKKDTLTNGDIIAVQSIYPSSANN